MKALYFFWIVSLSACSFGQPARHVLLISIDGFRPDFYLDNSWPAPNLQRLKQQGVYAKGVQSVFPSVTYPAHTTIVTGAYPAKHGIYYNAPFGAKKAEWYWNEEYIQVPTLWNAVREAGLTSASVMWPVTVGAPIDFNFPVKRADDDETLDQLAATRPLVTPASLVDDIEKRIGKLEKTDFNTNNTIDITIGKMASDIIKTHKPNLMAMHFVTVDHIQHAHGRNGATVKQAVALVDSMVGVVLQAVDNAGLTNSTTIIITGDHGFVDAHTMFSPNVLLAQNGLYNANDPIAQFNGVGGAAFLYLKDKTNKAVVEKILALLKALPAEQQQFTIIDRPALDAIGANPEVAMALAMNKGVVANSASKGLLLTAKKPGGSHGYFPNFNEINTGFIATGAGIGMHRQIEKMGIKDLSPVIAKLLNLKFSAPDGVLIPGILK